ncbi:DNA repair and recombination protein RAD54B-like isoform X2 [Panulirus ornatus]
MRRSAAPSQLHKKAPFRPPFVNPSSKRQCVETRNDGVPESSVLPQDREDKVEDRQGLVRSASDILSLIKKSSEKNNSVTSHCINTQDHQRTSLTECNKRKEVHNYVSDQGTCTSSLGPTHRNILKPSLCEPNKEPPQRLDSLPKVLSKQVRSWKRPHVNQEHCYRVLTGEENEKPQEVKYYSVVWCKRSRKKHKHWEGDAVLMVKSRTVILKDTEGKEIGSGSGYMLKDLSTLEEGSTLPVGNKEVEIQGSVSAESYASGECFHGQLPQVRSGTQVTSQVCRPKSKPFRLPTLGQTQKRTDLSNSNVGPLFDPTKPDAFVMPRPPPQHQWKYNSSGAVVMDVVIDPHISAQLRPHQHEGVTFLYECVMGYRLIDSFGAILADEMGLGKTLQCITLVWTLLKQGPYGFPVVKKVLIVTPSSLTSNWGKEFRKWLGRERINTYIIDQNNKVEDFSKTQHSGVMIVSYEMLVRYFEAIEAIRFDLLLCDEGHRLKNANIKTTSLLGRLCCMRRVILTGTPVQNDLQELFALVQFVNPGVFGSSVSFRRIYEDPIIASQQPRASLTDKELGASRAMQLNRITSLFILRRTQDIINRYLPPKKEFVVFCHPSETQKSIYLDILGCRSLKKCFSSTNAGDHFSAILALRKICNHPALLAVTNDQETHSELLLEAVNLLPAHIEPGKFDERDSGKLAVVSCMLWALKEAGNEKIVLVSNYTSTLDMLASLCTRYNYSYLRLDGSTATSKRQQLVDRFNSKYNSDFVFLLSSKAGGVGLNLIGASRILLYDIDWNPATDLQAMARVWRDGQKRKVFIYRLLMAGSLDEKMYQRQIRKQGLSGVVVDARDSDRVHFSTEELKDLFTLHYDTACQTHDLLDCQCDLRSGNSVSIHEEKRNKEQERACQLHVGSSSNSFNTTTMDQLQNWCHLAPPFSSAVVKDPCLEAASDFITFLFSSPEVMKQPTSS